MTTDETLDVINVLNDLHFPNLSRTACDPHYLDTWEREPKRTRLRKHNLRKKESTEYQEPTKGEKFSTPDYS